ncbi:MAG: 4-(cytidine 5'-diphospho)-2-C-methyl-D-erythritol kinase [Gordonibacter sp.]
MAATKSDNTVDLFAEARSAQIKDQLGRPASGTVKVVAPAKVNLFLGIGPRRADGYHDAVNIMHAVNLHDVLYMQVKEGLGEEQGLTVQVRTSAREGLAPLDVPPQDNLVYRAIMRLAERLGRTQRETIEVHLEKHIPAQAGLGGGSSDAAAALVGAARLWDVPGDHPALEEVARSLGSDVAFFLHGGCACFGGAGELFEQALAPMKKQLVLIKPDEGVSTAAAYRAFDECPQLVDAALEQTARQAAQAQEVPLFNNLAPAAERLLPLLADVRVWTCAQPGVEDVLLCGSGSTTFAVCVDFDAACRLSASARQRGWWARTTAFGSVKAAVMSRG